MGAKERKRRPQKLHSLRETVLGAPELTGITPADQWRKSRNTSKQRKEGGMKGLAAGIVSRPRTPRGIDSKKGVDEQN